METYHNYVKYFKDILYLAGIVFIICSFIQTMLTLSPRVTDLEKRVATNESKISTIETKIDIVLDQNKSIAAKTEDIYHIILDQHTKR